MATTFDKKTTAQEAAAALQNEIKGKNVLITGVSQKSLGAESVRVLAPYAKTLILVSRSQNKIDETIAVVLKESPHAVFKSVLLDLSSIESIKKAAAEVNALGLPIHVVLNNAAVPLNEKLTQTVDGYEWQIGSNYIGHFLFNSLILPSVKKAVNDVPGFSPRIVNVSSAAHAFGGAIRWDDWFFEKKPEEYNKWLGYAQAKTAVILYTIKLAKLLQPEGINVYSLHPGSILSTTMGSAPSIDEFVAFGLMDKDGNPTAPDLFKDLGTGTATQIIASFDPKLASQSGAYLNDAVVANEGVSDFAKDPALADKLWEKTETLLNHKFL